MVRDRRKVPANWHGTGELDAGPFAPPKRQEQAAK
jgi:hypothetical protein